MKKNNKNLFFETPKGKYRVFQKPRLVMFSEEKEVESWANTQPLYFYPFSWLDFLGKQGVRELYIQDNSKIAKQEIGSLSPGKVHFENFDEILIKFAKEKGHKTSVICNLEELSKNEINGLSYSDFIKIRVNNNCKNLYSLSNVPNEQSLSCIKVYAGENCDYQNIALQSKEIGFDFFHVAKRLIQGPENSKMSYEEKEEIINLKVLETDKFKVIIPSSLEEKFTKRFLITSDEGNVSSCNFLEYRLVLSKNNFYPCYTQRILDGFGCEQKERVKSPKNCLDCACIYENDMLSDIETKIESYKNPCFALEYIENGR